MSAGTEVKLSGLHPEGQAGERDVRIVLSCEKRIGVRNDRDWKVRTAAPSAGNNVDRKIVPLARDLIRSRIAIQGGIRSDLRNLARKSGTERVG